MTLEHDRDRRFLALLNTASVVEVEAWIADMCDPNSGASALDDWKQLAIKRAFKRLTGKDFDQP